MFCVTALNQSATDGWLGIGRSAGAANSLASKAGLKLAFDDYLKSRPPAYWLGVVSCHAMNITCKGLKFFITSNTWSAFCVWLLDLNWRFIFKNHRIPKCKPLSHLRWITGQNNRITPFDLNFCLRLHSHHQYTCYVFFSLVQLLSGDILCCTVFTSWN